MNKNSHKNTKPMKLKIKTGVFEKRYTYSTLMRIGSLLILMTIFGILGKGFFSTTNVLNILRQSSVLTLLALGMTLVMINSGIDLSVAGVMTTCACFCGVLLREGVPVPLAIVLTIFGGILIGASSGTLVGFVGLPPFVATYGMLWICDGLSLALMQGQIIFGFPASYRFLGSGHIGIIPMIVVITAIVALLVHLFLSKTIYGQYVYAMGGNMMGALYSGVKIRKMRVLVFALSGATASIAGLLQSARLNAAEVSMSGQLLTLAIASVMVGGTNRLGGEGGVVGTIVGALILTTATNGMNLLGVAAEWQPFVVGLVVIFSVLLNDITVRNIR
jgi:ribose transport system permease protein